MLIELVALLLVLTLVAYTLNVFWTTGPSRISHGYRKRAYKK